MTRRAPCSTQRSSRVGEHSMPRAAKPKAQRPYKITNTREVWTEEEHKLFLEALQLYQRDWKRIAGHIGT